MIEAKKNKKYISFGRLKINTELPVQRCHHGGSNPPQS
jgi:hypothetical protein